MKRILMTDTTLCAESATALSFREKLEIAKLLDKMKVDCIDFGTIRNAYNNPLININMKKKYLSVALIIALAGSILTTSCIGSFS
ncbi:MAG: hypothetical protein IIX15_00885, partial [Clostridia bacterium]|nr:hypothetical protein [Clostridia bacterium]